MARSFDACMVDLTASGVDQEKARRACMAGFWAEHGMFPDKADQQGLELGGDCTGYAYFAVAEMSSNAGDRGPVFFGGAISPLQGDSAAKLQAFQFDLADKTTPDSLLVEVQMMAPGTLIDATGREFTFTEDDMFAYRDNFNPLDQPPVVLDHELSAKATVGRVRGLRVDSQNRLIGLWEILGVENVKPVLDKRWNRTSGRFVQAKDRSQKVVIEGSIVWSGAYDRGFGDRAQILLGSTKGRNTMSDTQKDKAAPKLEDQLAAVLSKFSEVTEKLSGVTEKVEAIEAKMSAAEKVAAESVAELATATGEEIEGLDPQVQAAVAKLEAKWQSKWDAKEQEDAKKARLQADTEAVDMLASLGKCAPADIPQELAVMSALPEKTRETYLNLRKGLPSKIKLGPRESAVLAKGGTGAHGAETDQEAEEKEFAQLGADRGFAPPAAAKGGASV